jgi:hypothetical protein
MKSIGLNIILSQIGYYVAAEQFIFAPYLSLFTRIIGNDNFILVVRYSQHTNLSLLIQQATHR